MRCLKGHIINDICLEFERNLTQLIITAGSHEPRKVREAEKGCLLQSIMNFGVVCTTRPTRHLQDQAIKKISDHIMFVLSNTDHFFL